MVGKNVWLTCQANEGMFQDEFSVVSETYEGKTFSLFAKSEMLKEKHTGDNYLNVLLHNIHGNIYDIVLPEEPFETEQIVSVRKEQVVEKI